MVKITFMGAGSTIFARNVLGDCMCTPVLSDAQIALLSGSGKPEKGTVRRHLCRERHPGRRI